MWAAAGVTLLLLRCVSVPGYAAACLYLSAWAHVALLVWMVKEYTARERPALRLVEGLFGHPPPWLARAHERRAARWPLAVSGHSAFPNALHAFPSFDAAVAGYTLTPSSQT